MKGNIVSRLVRLISVGSVLSGIFVLQPYRPVVFMGKSMTPTYQNHEFALASTDTSKIQKGDVVVIDTPNGQIVKRIAYMPGDWIERYYQAGEWSDVTPSMARKASKKSREKFKFTRTRIPEGFVYVLGDNPLVSVDSRQMGVLPISAIRCVLVEPKVQKPLTSADYPSNDQ